MEFNDVPVLQNQIRDNSKDLQKYLLDLECWEKEMKKKEEEFKLIRTTPVEEIPPIRNLLYRSKRRNRHKKQKDKIANKEQIYENDDTESEAKEKPEVGQTEELIENSSDFEEDLEILRRKQVAYLHKEKGNEFFKQGKYDSAINSYTTGLQLDPENPLLPANRAMAFLKKDQFQAAENDCTISITLDTTYVKAYLRRGTARKKLNKFSLAKADFIRVLDLEPENKQAQLELQHIAMKCFDENTDSNHEKDVKAQKLCPDLLRSKSATYSEESIIHKGLSSSLTNIENKCIFPHSSSVKALKTYTFDTNLNKEIEIKDMDEENFVKLVNKRVKYLKDNPEESTETLIDDSKLKLRLPPVPNTSFQFLSDWNEIKSDPDICYKYLKQFSAQKLPVIFKHHMEPEILSAILETLSSSFLEHGDDIFDYMKYLTAVGRFNTMIMFLCDKEEKDLNKLLDCIKTSKRPESEISHVLQKYNA